MARVALIGGVENEASVDLAAAWRALGIEAELLSAAEALVQLAPGDLAIGRLDVRRTLDGVEPGLRDLAALAASGVRVLNRPRALVNAHDKLRTARLLARRHLRHIPTRHVRHDEDLARLVLEPPIVLKPRFGSWGADVLRCESEQEIEDAFATIVERAWFRRHGVLVQPLLPPQGHDLRVLVAAGEVVGCDIRVAAPGEWRTNISLGGSELPAQAGPQEAALALAAVAALGGDLFGVDLMPTSHGPVVVEVNAAVEFDQAYARPGGDIYRDLADALQIGIPDEVTVPALEAAAVLT